MLVVGATNKDGTEFFESAQGDQVQVWAPGKGIRQASHYPPWNLQYLDDNKGTSLGTSPVFSFPLSLAPPTRLTVSHGIRDSNLVQLQK